MEQHVDIIASYTKMILDFIPTLLMAILTLIIGLWIIRRIIRYTDRLMEKRNLDETIRPFLGSLINIVLTIMLLLSVAGMFGIQTTSFIALFSTAALSVGLALQGSLGHFASGILLLIFKPYKVGDLVNAAGMTGTVESIQVFNTVLATLDNRRIVIPNGSIAGAPIINITGQGIVRVDIACFVSETANIDLARNAISAAVATSPLVLADKPVRVVVQKISHEGVELCVQPWCKSDDYWEALYAVQELSLKALAKAGIEGPVSAMSVTLTNTRN